MKKNIILTLCVGAVLGAALMSVIIWAWQTLTGNISMITIIVVIAAAAGGFLFYQIRSKRAMTRVKRENFLQLEKYRSYYYLLSSWMVLRNKGRMLSEYFKDHNFKNVAIYGLGRLGICLYEELKRSEINIIYAIDHNAAHFSYLDLKVVTPESQLEPVDVIIVTPVSEYEKITTELRERTSSKIINLEDVISSI